MSENEFEMDYDDFANFINKPPLSPETIEVIRGKLDGTYEELFDYDGEEKRIAKAQEELNAAYGGGE